MSAGRGGSGSGVNTPSIGSGGADGTATGGLINIHGGYGSDGQQGSYYSFGNGAASFWGEVVVLVLLMVLQPKHMVLAEVLLMTPLFQEC